MHSDKTAGGDNGAVTLLDYLKVVARYNGMIVRITVAAFVLAVAVAFALPNIYSATAQILPPPQSSSASVSALLGQLGGLANLAGDLSGGGTKTNSELLASILKCEPIKDAIIGQFKLKEVYGKKYREDVYARLEGNTSITVGKKDGIISIRVEDKDPKRVAALANAYVAELEKLTVKLNVMDVGTNRAFLEKRLIEAREDLIRAEEALKVFQQQNKVVQISEQAQITMKGIAELKAQQALNEVQLATLRRQFTDDSQEVKNLKTSINKLKAQIERMEGAGNNSSVPSIGAVPALGQSYLRVMREFKIQEAMVEMLTKQYELAQLNEANNDAQFQVLQPAQVPDKKSRPRRVMIVLLTTFVAFIFSIGAAFLRGFFAVLPEKERNSWCELLESFPAGRLVMKAVKRISRKPPTDICSA